MMPSSFRLAVRPASPAARLGRAAIFAFGVGVAGSAVAGCGGSSSETEPPVEPAPADPTTGGATEPDPGVPPDQGGPPDDDYGGAAPEYGVPPED
jgi:hypothetical protein